MAKINVHGCGHGSKSETYAGGLVVHYNAFTATPSAANARLDKVKRAFAAVDRLDKKMSLAGACNIYFSSLPKGHHFRHFWRDNSIFINYHPSTAPGLFAATHSNDKDIALTRWCIDHHGHWMIGATIVHEFAHVAGAPGGASHSAELAVKECGFGPQYNPTIMGSLRRLAAVLENLA